MILKLPKFPHFSEIPERLLGIVDTPSCCQSSHASNWSLQHKLSP